MGFCARRSERTKGAHPDPAGFVADPEKFRLLRKLDRRDETILSLRRQLSAKDAYIARLEGMLGIVHRGGTDGRIDPKPGRPCHSGVRSRSDTALPSHPPGALEMGML